MFQQLREFFGEGRERNVEAVRSVAEETVFGRMSNVTPGGKFLDHLLESV